MTTNDLINDMQKEIQNQRKLIEKLKKLVAFYEEIILSNDELKDKMKNKPKFNYYKGEERRKH